jgi:hypothetical protein
MICESRVESVQKAGRHCLQETLLVLEGAQSERRQASMKLDLFT